LVEISCEPTLRGSEGTGVDPIRTLMFTEATGGVGEFAGAGVDVGFGELVGATGELSGVGVLVEVLLGIVVGVAVNEGVIVRVLVKVGVGEGVPGSGL
jgi:hypothetical protein